MSMRESKTYIPKAQDIKPQWRVIDATGQTLGRMASRISRTLQGKDKPIYTPYLLTGDYVVVTNASRVRVTGRKLTQKLYYRHSGHTGNLKTTMLRDMLQKYPERVIRLAVKGMLPGNKLGREMLKRLKVYAGDASPHDGQILATQEGR